MINPKSYVRITEDHSEAWLYLCEPVEASEYNKSEVIDYLQLNKVIVGINESHIAAMCKKKIYGREVKVATSEKGENGNNGYYEFLFSLEKKKPKINKDGSVDYKSMSLIESVQAGQVIARYHPAVQGTPGRTVTGEADKPLNFKDLRPLVGKGHSNEADPNEYVATKTGRVEYDGNNRIDINEVYEVPGNCDFANNPVIEFSGDIIISGNVAAGVVINAGKSVTVEGVVEAANITAGTDVCLKRGMQGAGKGVIKAGGDLYTEFIEYATVNVRGSVQSNVILNSNVKAGQNVKLTGKKGLIAGGTVHGMMGIECITAGNTSEIKTVLHVGVEPEVIEKSNLVNEEYRTVNEELDEIVGGIAKILRVRQQTGELSEQLTNHLINLKNRKDEVFIRCNEAKKKAEQLDMIVNQAREASIKISGNIYHGVTIGVNDHEMHIQRDTSFMEYNCVNGIIEGTVIVA